jgi:predicted aconitase with swiveling domain
MKKIVLKGRKVFGGTAEGYALVTKDALGGMGVFDVSTGMVTESGNDWEGKVVTGKVLVYKTGKGSSSWAGWYKALSSMGTGPVAHVITKNNSQTALGVVLSRVPAVTELDQDPTEVISTGDWIKVDGDNGIVEVTKNQP